VLIKDGVIQSVMGVPAFNIPVPTVPKSVSQGCITIYSDDNIYTQKSIGTHALTCQPGDAPSSNSLVFGHFGTDLAGTNGGQGPLIHTSPYSPSSSSAGGVTDTIDCSFIYNETLVAAVDQATISSCVKYLQFGCPTVTQLMHLQTLADTSGGSPGPSMPPGRAPSSDAVGALVAKAEHIVNDTQSTIKNAIFGKAP
jgi:hypothetical protein